MNMFNKIFGSPDERRARDILKKAERETSAIYGPLGNLSLGIVTAAWDSYRDFASFQKVSIEGQPSEPQMLVFYEFLYFFIHIAMRAAVGHGLTEPQISKIQDFLGPNLSKTAVDTFCRHWPLEFKERIAGEFLENLNNAEADYSECRELMSKDKPFNKDSLLGRLSFNVANVWGSPSNPVIMIAATTSAADAFASLAIDKLVGEVAAVIDRVEPEMLDMLRQRDWR